METKVCKRCGIEKDVSEFYKNGKNYQSECKYCSKISKKERLEKKKEKIKNIVYDDNDKKVCSKCGNEYPETPDYFAKSLSGKKGLEAFCKKCKGKHRQNYSKEMRNKNKNKIFDENILFKCISCNKEYPYTPEYFNLRSETKSGLRNLCKKCDLEIHNKIANKYIFENLDKEYDDSIKKICNECKNEYPATLKYFSKMLHYKDGLNTKCRKCIKTIKKNRLLKLIRNNKDKNPFNKSKKSYCRECKKYLPKTEKYFYRNDSSVSGISDICIKCDSKLKKDRYNYFFKASSKSLIKELSIYEEIRIDPNNDNLIQCKCYNCKQWFNPIYCDVVAKLTAVNHFNRGSCNLYCSNECKKSCEVFGKSLHREGEYKNSYRKIPLWLIESVKENAGYKCEICESKDNLQVHHIQPYTLHPQLGLDREEMICLCFDCHNKYGHSDGCKRHEIQCKNGKINFDKLEN